MPQFRPELAISDGRLIDGERIREACAAAARLGNFYVAPPQQLAFEHVGCEEHVWELFHGRLLDASQTRERRSFESWCVYWISADGVRSAESIVAIRWDEAAGRLFVTRAILCHGHESFIADGNVVLTREVQKWQRELVGTIVLADLKTVGELRDELACQLFLAVVGTSRLPLTSIEAPLPSFALGQLCYQFRPDGNGEPMTTIEELSGHTVNVALAEIECTKLLELQLKTGTNCFSAAPSCVAIADVFNAASLSPYTSLVPNSLALLRRQSEQGSTTVAQQADLLGLLIRQLGRHLAAYDLITFHHRGANYPDALFLDELLTELFHLVGEHPQLIEGDSRDARLRRRALRNGSLLRIEYARHAVPDQPTSPGENLRVLPAPFARVPDEQIESSITRERQLFADEWQPAEQLMRASLTDLDQDDELAELGTALYLDRPLGFSKAPGEPDQTLLCSHILFSKSIAEHRLNVLHRCPAWLPDKWAIDRWRERLQRLDIDGLPLAKLGPPPRPGVISLHDTARIAGDFVVLRTTRRTLRDFGEQYDMAPILELGFPLSDWRLLIPGGTEVAPTLCVYDQQLCMRLELVADLSRGYGTRGGVEFPVAGIRVVRAWNEHGEPIHVDVTLRPV